MNMTTATNPTAVKSKVEDLADTAAARAGSAIDSAKKHANEALDTLQDGVEDLRKAAPSALTRAAGQVEDLARRTLEKARDAKVQVTDRATRVGDASVAYVRDEPVKSVLIAAATGAAVAALVGWMCRSRSSSV